MYTQSVPIYLGSNILEVAIGPAGSTGNGHVCTLITGPGPILTLPPTMALLHAGPITTSMSELANISNSTVGMLASSDIEVVIGPLKS